MPDNIQPQDDEVPKDKYERIREELGYDDEEVRMLAVSIKTGLMNVLGSRDDDKLMFLFDERIKRDFEFLGQLVGEESIVSDIKKMVSENPGMLIDFVEVAKGEGGIAVNALAAVKEVYGNDMEKFKGFAEVAKGPNGDDAVKALAKVQEVYGNDLEKFKGFAEVANGPNGGAAVNALAEAKEVYGNELDKFKGFVEVLKGRHGFENVKALAAAKEVYGNDMEKFKVFVEVAKENGGNAVRALAAVKEVYGIDMEKFKVFAEVAEGPSGWNAVYALAAAKEVYGNELEKLKEVKDLIAEVAEGPSGCHAVFAEAAVRALVATEEVYGNDMDKFKGFVEVAKGPNGHAAVRALAATEEVYGNDLSAFIKTKNTVVAVCDNNDCEEGLKAFRHGDYSAHGVLDAAIRANPEYDFFTRATGENAIFLMEVYAGIDEEKFPGFEVVRGRIKDKVNENKDGILLDRLIQLRDMALRDPSAIDDVIKASLKRIVDNGLPHFRVLEATVEYIQMLIDQNFTIEERQLSDEIIGKTAKYRAGVDGKIKRSKKTADYKNTDLASFYEKSVMIHTGSSEVHVLAMDCFNALARDTKNYLLMQNGVLSRLATICSLFKVIPSAIKNDKQSEIDGLLTKMKERLLGDNNKDNQKAFIVETVEKLNRILIDIFGSLGLKNLPEITDKMTPLIVTYLTYLSNMAHSDEHKRNVLILFLLLKILNKWDAFKRGEEIDVEQYLNDDISGNVKKYLEERKELDIFAGVVPEQELEEWSEVMVSKTEVIMMGESRGVVDVLDNINNSYGDLLDPDNFESKEEADRLLPVVKGFTDFVENQGLEKKIDALNNILLPEPKVVEVFGKIGESMTTDSGVIPVNEDISYLEGVLHKNVEKLTDDEMKIAGQYIAHVKDEVMSLYVLRDKLEKVFREMLNSVKNIKPGAKFDERLKDYMKVFESVSANKEVHLKVVMTGDLVEVISHIRQCLACKTKECNNDTNLTFGDRNRFLVITRQANMVDDNSISDELVTVQKTKAEGAEGNAGYSFVMDNVYGNRTRDILVANVLAVVKKMQQLKKISPAVEIDVFVTNAALSSCSVGIEYLSKKLKDEGYDLKLKQMEKTVSIAKSAGGDGYYEIGGGNVRSADAVDWKISGIKVSI